MTEILTDQRFLSCHQHISALLKSGTIFHISISEFNRNVFKCPTVFCLLRNVEYFMTEIEKTLANIHLNIFRFSTRDLSQ